MARVVLECLLDSSAALILIFIAVLVLLQRLLIRKGAEQGGTGGKARITALNCFLAAVLAVGIWATHVAGLYPPERDPIMALMIVINPTILVLALVVLLKIAARVTNSRFITTFASIFTLISATSLIILMSTAFLAFILPEPFHSIFRDPATTGLITGVSILALFGYWWIKKDTTNSKPFVEWLESLMEPAQTETTTQNGNTPTTQDRS